MGTLQRFVTNFKKIGKERLARENLTARLETLESYWSQVLRTHFALCEFKNIDDTECTKQDLLSDAESQYFAAKSKFNELLNKELVTESASNKTCCHNETPRSELPKVMIPEFDGNINKWEDFRDMFVSVIHNDLKIPLIKKMHYLKGCFKGDASAVISRMELKITKRHGNSSCSVTTICNDDWRVTYMIFSKPSHSLKRRWRASAPPWTLFISLCAR